jgi:hypothetical protein
MPPFFDETSHHERVKQLVVTVSPRFNELPTDPKDLDAYLYHLAVGAFTNTTNTEKTPTTVWETRRADLANAVVTGDIESYINHTDAQPALTGY